MSKLAILVCSLLMSFTAHAHNPIIPWPLDSDRQDIALADIEGYWSAGQKTDLCLDIAAAASDKASISIYLRDEKEGQMSLNGWLRASDRSFIGDVEDGSNHPIKVLMLRSEQKFYLRLVIDGKTHYFQLHRSETCTAS